MTTDPTTTASPNGTRPAADDGEGEMIDVWSRSGSKYRIRAVVLLAVNVLLFSGVACFAYWIRSGVMFAPSMSGYRGELSDAFDFQGPKSVTLAHLLVEPISVQDVPMQIVILGMLMATLIAVPILISILYRFWSCIPFLLGVCLLAVMPWLSITLLGSCIIASLKPFRTRFRFVSALAGLVPIVVYLALAWHGSEEMVMGRFAPIDRIKFIAPWVLAAVSSAFVFAIVLVIAKLVDYRPGAIAPLLAIMFGVPIGLFEYHVGRDELHYRLLETLNAYYFMPWDATLDLTEKVERRWTSHPIPRPSWDALYESEQQRWQSELDADPRAEQSVLAKHKAELVRRCDSFLRVFPGSRYALNVLYIKARAMDVRVDPREFRENNWIRFYDGFPSRASEQTWKTLERNGPYSPTRAVALLNLAKLEARFCHMDRAQDYLDALIERFEDHAYPSKTTIDQAKGVLERARPETSLNINMANVLLEAHALRDMLKHNADPLYAYEPLCNSLDSDEGSTPGLLLLHPRHERFRGNLTALLREYPNCQLEDNILLELAKSTPETKINPKTGQMVRITPSRTEQLRSLIDDYPKGDARAEALYRLGAALVTSGRGEESKPVFQVLADDYPDSIWSRQAARFGNYVNTVYASRQSP
ncbi:MAG: tetratricopeptide repeat protein [Planctomycetota bacterium]|jgi:outer membrane protein assembly factor BamD (BamD/ComL family)